MQTQNILGFNFINATNQEFHQELNRQLQQEKNTFVVTANPEIVTYALAHPQFSTLIQKADYLTPDGIGIIYAAKQLQRPLNERITGYDTFRYLLNLAQENQLKILLYGAKPEVLNAVKAKITDDYPKIKVVGAFDGYLTDLHPLQEQLKKAQPQLVFVALGSPKQEEFINQNFKTTTAIWMGIGGSFDVFSGKVKRAPKWIQKMNLEWLYRLITNPKRFKRYLAIPRFLKLVRKTKKDAAAH